MKTRQHIRKAKGRRSFTKLERLSVWRKTNGHCAYCGDTLPVKGWHVDHIHPNRRGGTNAIANLNPACRPCNLFKHTYGLEGFREQLQEQVARGRAHSVNFRMAERYKLITVNPDPTVTFFFETQHGKA